MKTIKGNSNSQSPLDPQWAQITQSVETVITISSSSKFYGAARSLAAKLADAGFKVYTPDFDFDETRRVVSERDKRKLTRSFMEKIRLCTHLYVLAEGGYVGKSVCLEIGYAFSRRKRIVLSEPADELAVRALTSEIVPLSKVCEHFVHTDRSDDSSLSFPE